MASSSVAAPAHILGHYRMEEAPRRDLVPLSDARYGRVTLRRSAAAAWRRMAAAAAADGVTLIPVSGFRSIAHQERLFFDVKAARGQTAAERALVSAPPGHSEHHTGYAVDVRCVLYTGPHTTPFAW
jgi:D-alanyl-D-alanine carboxypeptidase